MVKVVIAFLLVTCSCAGIAQESLQGKPVVDGKEFRISSKHIDDAPAFQVFLPKEYEYMAEHVRYPVIYTLDGWALTQSVSGVVEHLSNTASMPKAIVVAIQTRNDYSWGPTLFPSESGWGAPKDKPLKGFSRGTGDGYLAFVKNELMPFIDKRFRTNNFSAVIGMSPSATFVLHSFVQELELFDAHIVFAATDVIGMGYKQDSTFIQHIADSMAKTPDRKGFLYVASAAQEAEKNPARNNNVAALTKALAPYKNLKLRVEHIENFGHYSMALPGLLSAIDLIFPRKDWEMSSRFGEMIKQPGDFMDNLLSYYKELGKNAGFEVYPNTDLRRNAGSLRVAGNRLRGAKRFDEAEKLYRYWIKNSPEAVKAWAGLASTLNAKGDKGAAKVSYQKALTFARLQQSDWVPYIQETLEKLEKEQ